MRDIRSWARIAPVALAALLASACGGGGDGDQGPRVQYSSMVSFGDSLSDVGTYATGGAEGRLRRSRRIHRQRCGRPQLDRAARRASPCDCTVRSADRPASLRAARWPCRSHNQSRRLHELRPRRRARHQPDRAVEQGAARAGRHQRLPRSTDGSGGHADRQSPRRGRRQVHRHRTGDGTGRRQRCVPQPRRGRRGFGHADARRAGDGSGGCRTRGLHQGVDRRQTVRRTSSS